MLIVTGLSVIAGPLSGANQYLGHITQILASINDEFCATSDDVMFSVLVLMGYV